MLDTLLDDRYRIAALIGEGGMGRVYRAEQLRVGREVAVKVIREDRPSDARVYRRFIEEARACSALQHPNVVTVHDFGQAADGTLYLVMELLQGQLLSSAIRRGEVGARRAVEVGAQICAGLAAAHALGLVHQDLKPANVMLCRPEGVGDLVKILDFGVVGVADELRQSGQLRGSPSYMSPEQIRGGRVDARADIYALGATLYEMLAGRPPFDGEVAEILRQHCQEPPPPLPSSVPEALRQLVEACLAKLPEERPRSMGVLQGALVALMSQLVSEPGDAGAGGGRGALTVTGTVGTAAGDTSPTGSTSWIGEHPGDPLPGAPALAVSRVLESLPSRSVVLAEVAGEAGTALRVRRHTLEQRAGRWAVELALERWLVPLFELSHPAVLSWRRSWWVGDVLYLAGDVPSGEGLDAALHREGRLAPARALRVARALCGGLAALHGLEIVHGDLRPGTALSLPDGGAALLDPALWALSERGVSVLSAEATLRATRYKAPEQFRIQGELAGPAADLYALGALLYELLTGRPPFLQESPEALLEAKQTARYPPVAELTPGLPPALDALVAGLLQPRPEDRPRSARALDGALREVSPGGEAAALTSGRFHRLDARGRLVGRADEERALAEALEDARAGHGRLILLQGAPGMGRSRLLEGAVAAAQRQGALVLRCSAQAPQRGDPLRVARTLCEDLDRALVPLSAAARADTLADLRAEGANHGGALRGLAPLLNELFQDEPIPPPERDRITRALLALTLALARRPRWLVIAVDDLQWVDGGTLRWLERLALLLPRLPALALLTSRDGAEGPLVASPTATHLRLAPLPLAAIHALLRERFGERRELEAAAAALEQRSGGNPAALMELLREGARLGAFVADETGWCVAPGRLSALPPAAEVLSRAAAALSALPPSSRATLAAAAAWSGPFDAAVLRALSPGCEVVAPLAAAARIDALEELPGGRWRFRHEALRAAAEALVDGGERARLHRAAAAWLASGGGEAAPVSEHLLQCPPEPEDVIWLRRAAGEAIDADDGEAAVRFARAALARGGPELVGEGRLLLARALDNDSALDEAVACYESILAEAAPDALSPDQRLEVITDLSRVLLESGQLDAALEVLEGALAALGWRRPPPPVAAALAAARVVNELVLRPRGALVLNARASAGRHLGALLLLRGATQFAIDQRASMRSALEGLAHVRRAGAPGLYSRGLSLFALLFTLGVGWRSTAARLLRYALEAAERSGDMESLRMAQVTRINLLLVRGELEAAEALAREVEAGVYRLGKEHYIALLVFARVQSALMQGRLQVAADAALRLHDLRARPSGAETPWPELAAALCLAGMGDGPRLLALLDRLGEMDVVRQRPVLMRRLRMMRAAGLIFSGRWEEALALSRTIRAGRGQGGRWSVALMSLNLSGRMLDAAMSEATPVPQRAALLLEVRAIARWTRRATRGYPVTDIGARFIRARIALAEGRTDSARAQLQRLVPRARAALGEASVIRAHVLATAGALAGGQQSPEGRALLGEARASLEHIHPAQNLVAAIERLCDLEPRESERGALVDTLEPIIRG